MINIKLGIVYYQDELILHNKLDYIEYIKISNPNEIKLINRPTLIIGWSLAKERIINIDILNKDINSLHFWTFSFNEKRNDYISDLNKFTKIDILNIFNFYKFNILSPIFNKDLMNINDYINYFNDCKLNSIFVSKNIQLTILCDSNIYRINLKELNYYNIDVKPLLEYLKNKYKNFIYDRSGNIEKIYLEYFKFIDENIVTKYIPLFIKAS